VTDSDHQPPGQNRGLRRARLGLIGLVVIVGLVSAAIAFDQEQQSFESRQNGVGDRSVVSARSTAMHAVAGLSGASALVDSDGEVGSEAFERFQRAVMEGSALQALAYIPVVPATQRPAYESEAGSIVDLDGDRFETAAERDEYWPVRTVLPDDPLGRPLIGVDVAHFPLSAAVAREARDSGEPRFTEAIVFTEELSIFFVLKPIYRAGVDEADPSARRAGHAGFFASVYTGEDLAAELANDLPEGVDFVVRDGATVLATSERPPQGGVQRTLDVGGRTWMLQVQDRRDTGHPLTWLILAVTALVAFGLVLLYRRSSRYEREMRATTALIQRTADLAQRLSGAATVEEVAAEIKEHVPRIFGARSAAFGLLDRERRTATVLGGSVGRAEMPLEALEPLAAAVRSGGLALDEGRGRARSDASPDAGSSAAMALTDRDRNVVAGVVVSWRSPRRFDAPTVAALRTLAELCEQTLRRAEFTDQISRGAEQLAFLAEGFAGAATVDQTALVVNERGRQPVAAVTARIGVVDTGRGVLVLHEGAAATAGRESPDAVLPLEEGLPITEAMRTGRPVLLEVSSVVDEEGRSRRSADGDALTPSGGARAALPLRDDEETIGAIEFIWDGRRIFDGAFVSTLWTIADMAAQAIRRARLIEAQVDEARHNRDLARLAQDLTGRAHTEDVTGYLAAGVVTPLDASHAAVGLVRDGMLHRHFSSPLPDTGRAEVERVLEPTPLGESMPLTDAARTGEDVLLADPGQAAARYPTVAAMWEAVGFQATANLALRDRNGRVIGALGVAWDHPVVFGKELRDRLTTVAGIAAQTLERAQLSDQLRDTANRNELLADLAQIIAGARTTAEVGRALVEHGASPVEATSVSVGLLDEFGEELVPLAHPGIDPINPRGWLRPSLTGGHPVGDVLRTHRPVLLSSADRSSDRYPAFGGELAAAGIEAAAYLPLLDADGTTMGAIGFGWGSEQEFTPGMLATLRTIAQMCAQTVERSRLGEAEHRLVASLQSRVITPLPQVRSLSIAQRYLPAARQVGMGGDWFEGIACDEHRYAIVLGDIAGHGINAVADMIELRSVIGSMVRAGTSLGEIFPLASTLLQGGGNAVTASAWIGIVDTSESSVTYVTAGHPPPLMRTASGQVLLLEGGRHPLLGVPSRRQEPATAPFVPGSVLVAYTDGLIERRAESIDASIERARKGLQVVVGGDSEVVADHLIGWCLEGEEPDDDVALVVVSHNCRD
jgi:GAF domain-containing protein/CHASE1-domain containing sensor protein